MKNTLNKDPRDRLIFALDLSDSLDRTLDWVDLLKERVGIFKVGKEAFTRFGPEIVHRIQVKGPKVFLDLKYHDIPNTVARAAEVAFDLGVAIFNVHALGGKAMMQGAVAALKARQEKKGGVPPIILAVTVLTSMGDDDLKQLGYTVTASHLTLVLARIAQDAGATGVVASPEDITAIRQACGEDFVILTPGIRGAARIFGDDQRRVLSAEEAVRLGADYLVVGRPIAMAPDPLLAAEEFLASIAKGLNQR
ncbi:MAG: orotidine-5'-phosphate decarboxylase [Smithellaceae bacterium]|nr:orotidine-5'-phosphate decarboxylase [Smithellaceae bacterium]